MDEITVDVDCRLDGFASLSIHGKGADKLTDEDLAEAIADLQEKRRRASRGSRMAIMEFAAIYHRNQSRFDREDDLTDSEIDEEAEALAKVDGFITEPEQLVRLVELTASYIDGAPQYWNDKDAQVLIDLAKAMTPCNAVVGMDIIKSRGGAIVQRRGRNAV